jgi:hypothetical protein
MWRGRFWRNRLRCQRGLNHSPIDHAWSAIPSPIAGVARSASCHPAQIVERDVQAHGGDVAIQVFGKAIGQPRKAA